MKLLALLSLVLFVVAGMALAGQEGASGRKRGTVLVHAVYFDLKDDSPAAVDKLVALCDKYLDGHEGTVHYAAGARSSRYDREVNDQEFDVSLYVVFENDAAHDKYQTHPRHLKFIEEGRDNWKRVRVFDSYIPASE